MGRLSVRAFGLVEEIGRRSDLPTGRNCSPTILGRALQLTNILRDLDEDAARGRLYLPREALERAGVVSFAPHAALSLIRLEEACAAVALRAREHYDEADLIMARSQRE